MHRSIAPVPIVSLLALVACDSAPVERVDLRVIDQQAFAEVSLSPDTEGARWSDDTDGLSIAFGKEGERPYLSLACEISQGRVPRLSIIRHAEAEPGAKALFALLGNGIAARLRLDATLSDEGWRWEGNLPAAAGELDVFTGPRMIEATLPGAGRMELPASAMPREFVEWCRRGGIDAPDPAVRPEEALKPEG